MNIEGTYTLQATPEDVSKCLTDQKTLQHSIPGVERLEALGEQTYAIALHIEHNPLIGLYQGHIKVIEQDNPYHFHLVFEGEGQQSKINSDWKIELDGHIEDSVVAYKANVSLTKSPVHISTPLVKGAIKLLIQEFFTSLAEQLPISPSNIAVPVDEDSLFEIEQLEPPMLVSPSDAQPTLALSIVRWLHLGAGDTIVQDQWVRRVRRLGISSILLLLVWIGTRLPRR